MVFKTLREIRKVKGVDAEEMSMLLGLLDLNAKPIFFPNRDLQIV